MSLASEARDQSGRMGGLCSIGSLLDRLTEPDRNELIEALTDPEVESSALSRVMRRRDIAVIAAQTIGRHRRGDCACP